jgi:hypothetical protein
VPGNGGAQSLRDLQVDHDVELDRPMSRQIAWLVALQNMIHIGRRTAVQVDNIAQLALRKPDYWRAILAGPLEGSGNNCPFRASIFSVALENSNDRRRYRSYRWPKQARRG